MVSQYRWKITFILVIWLFLLAWCIRIWPQLGEASIGSSYVPMEDNMRHYIVESGRIISERNRPVKAKSLFSSWFNGQLNTFGSILLAILTIMLGDNGLIQNLQIIQKILIHTLILFPIVAVLWYKQACSFNDSQIQSHALVAIVGVALFPMPIFILKFSSGIRRSGYAITVFALLLYMWIRTPEHNKNYSFSLILLLFVIFLFNITHTISHGIFYLLIGSTIIIIVISNFSHSSVYQSLAKSRIQLLLLSGILYFVIGTSLNTNFKELIVQIPRLLDPFIVGVGSKANGVATEQSAAVFETSKTQFQHSTQDLLVGRKLAKILSRGTAALVISVFIASNINQYFRNKESNISFQSYFLTAMILLYIPHFVIMYSFGGFGQALSRTMIVGLPILIAIFSELLTHSDDRISWGAVGAAAFIVLSSIIGAVLIPKWSQEDITFEEQAAIQFTGTKTNAETPIFSDTQLGPGLGYYEREALFMVSIREVANGNYEAIYGCDDYQQATSGIKQNLRNQSLLQNSTKPFDGLTMLFTTRMNEDAHVWFNRVSTCPFFIEKFDISTNRIFDSGQGRVYRE